MKTFQEYTQMNEGHGEGRPDYFGWWAWVSSMMKTDPKNAIPILVNALKNTPFSFEPWNQRR